MPARRPVWRPALAVKPKIPRAFAPFGILKHNASRKKGNVMLTLPSTPELESRLEAEAAKRGLQASEYALRLIEGLMQAHGTDHTAEQIRLDAVDQLIGAAADSSFSTEALRRERNEERAREEERHLRRFGREQSR